MALAFFWLVIIQLVVSYISTLILRITSAKIVIKNDRIIVMLSTTNFILVFFISPPFKIEIGNALL